MICCGTCENWYHGDCVGISPEKGKEMEKQNEELCCRLCKGLFNCCILLMCQKSIQTTFGKPKCLIYGTFKSFC